MIGTLDPSPDAMMYADTLLPTLEGLARRAAEGEGVCLEWVELKRKRAAWVFRVFIDRVGGGATLDDCERVSRRLSLLLDLEDPIESSYTLEVSTPGLDRPLRQESDYRRFVGRLAKVETKQAVSGRRRFTGRIQAVRSGEVELRAAGGEAFHIPLTAIHKARLEVELPSSREGKHP